MALGEFDLIQRFFTRAPRRDSAVQLGVGDDCALLAPAAGQWWAVSCDMLVEGRHFLSTVAPQRLGHKALAVNLSDLAACGAEPVGFTLALALPRADEDFLRGFAQGMWALADAHGIELMGGDTTAGPLNICITVLGLVPPHAALRRDAARPGDEIWVSGCLGDARLALEVFRGTRALTGDDFDSVRRAMEQPQPRVALGLALRGLAHAAIDLSDGLLGDLGHVLRRSGVGATLDFAALPRRAGLARQPRCVQQLCLLSGGDDYELLFTAAPAQHAAVLAAAQRSSTAVRRIGHIHAAAGLQVLNETGQPMPVEATGFDHFKS